MSDICRRFHYVEMVVVLADDDEADTSSSDVLISRGLLSDLTSESAKLKSMGVTNQVCCF